MVLILQTDAQCPPGLLTECLHADEVPYRLVRLDQGETLPLPSEFSTLVVLGGRMGARDVAEFPFIGALRRYLLEAADVGAAILGICLGGQILADVLGGELKPRHRGEKGLKTLTLTPLGCSDPLFHNLPYQFVSYQWHSDSFDIPESGVLLARTSACPNQAFRYDEKIYGVQFHPEVTEDIVREWSEGQSGYVGDFVDAEEAYREFGEILFRNFFRIAGVAPTSH